LRCYVVFTSTRAVEAVGHDAWEMLGRSPGSLRPVRPIKDGVIADFDAAERMLTHFIQRAHRRLGTWLRPRVIIGIPTEITPVERRAVIDSAYRAKASDVVLVDEPMAAAVGAGLPIGDAAGNMIIDIGGGTTDNAAISLLGVVMGRSVRVAGDAMDEAIMQHVKKTHDLLVAHARPKRSKFALGQPPSWMSPSRWRLKGATSAKGCPGGCSFRMRRFATGSAIR
jgi:rod shape-determining protein MreB